MPSNVLCRLLVAMEPTEAKVPGRPGEKEACCAPPKTSVELDFDPFGRPARLSVEWVIALDCPPADSSCRAGTIIQVNQITLPKFFHTYLCLSC